MITIQYQNHRQGSRLKHPVGSTVIGTYQSRAGMEGVITDSRCRVKKAAARVSTLPLRKFYDTEVCVEWEDKKTSWTRTSKVICINYLSQDLVKKIKEAELAKRLRANARRREIRRLGGCK